MVHPRAVGSAGEFYGTLAVKVLLSCRAMLVNFKAVVSSLIRPAACIWDVWSR